MKKIFRATDKYGGSFEVMVLDGNIKVPEDLIYVRFKRKKEKEVGFMVQPWEAWYLVDGLFLAVDYIIDKYRLEKFKVKKLKRA